MVELLKSDTYGGENPLFLCYNVPNQKTTMKCKVQLYKAGTLFEEVVIAVDYQDAKKVATARNPGATVVSVTAVF